MICTKNVANAVGGKTARACDSCIKKRARWYCAADDAFLCEACDASVHSANSLARRHKRVRLKTASLTLTPISSSPPVSNSTVPSWHHGFTRKARTPRHGGNKQPSFQHDDHHQKAKPNEPTRRNHLVPDLVPEVGSDEIYSYEENEEEQLLYRVPIFDPFVSELCTSTTSTVANDVVEAGSSNESKPNLLSGYGSSKAADVEYSLNGFLPSDMDLAEFAADVESLLGRGLDNGSFGMQELGLMDCKEKEINKECSLSSSVVKIEEEEGITSEAGVIREWNADDMGREPFELSFDYDSPLTCGEEDHDNNKVIKGEVDIKVDSSAREEDDVSKKMIKKRKILLSLDYEAVITEWASHGSPWTTGDRPDFDLDECWPDTNGREVQQAYGEFGGIGAHSAVSDGGREARVSRYREKRRTRLFSKKIRYEVRKLNAEKRPRMKGRFIKRTSFAGPSLLIK